MRTEIVNVTPAKAREFLAGNVDNRQLRQSYVRALREAFERGEYTMTHQGVAVSTTGRLLDGQHRLTAIAQMDGGTFPMLVAWDCPDEAFTVIDTGRMRSTADLLREDRKLVEVARFMARLNGVHTSSTTAPVVRPYVELLRAPFVSLHASCSATARVWSAAPMRLAACISVLRGADEHLVHSVYRSLVLCDIPAMTPAASALYSSVARGVVSAADQADIFARGCVVFDPTKQDVTRVQVRSPQTAIQALRSLAASHGLGA